MKPKRPPCCTGDHANCRPISTRAPPPRTRSQGHLSAYSRRPLIAAEVIRTENVAGAAGRREGIAQVRAPVVTSSASEITSARSESNARMAGSQSAQREIACRMRRAQAPQRQAFVFFFCFGRKLSTAPFGEFARLIWRSQRLCSYDRRNTRIDQRV